MSSSLRLCLILLCLPLVFCRNTLAQNYAQSEPTPAQAFAKAEVVFKGKVISISDTGDKFYDTQVAFNVSRVWKGSINATTYVLTSKTEDFYGYPFDYGKTYLVYAKHEVKEDENGEKQEIGFWGGFYSGTKPLAYAGKDLAILGQGNPPLPAPLLFKVWSLLRPIAFILVALLALGVGIRKLTNSIMNVPTNREDPQRSEYP